MKKVLGSMSLLAVLASANAFALSTYVPIMQCTHPYDDSSITVNVSQYEGPSTLPGAPGSGQPDFDVEIYNTLLVQGQPQTQLAARFQGVQLQVMAPGIYGASENFVAQGLTLAVSMTPGQNNAGYPAQLNATVNGREISIQVFCLPATNTPPAGALPPTL